MMMCCTVYYFAYHTIKLGNINGDFLTVKVVNGPYEGVQTVGLCPASRIADEHYVAEEGSDELTTDSRKLLRVFVNLLFFYEIAFWFWT